MFYTTKHTFYHYSSIFTYDYKQIAKQWWPIHKELIQNRFHPKNIKYFSGWGFKAFDDYEEW